MMLAIGNSLANSVWECQVQNMTKPNASSSREEKERWIRAKYENKEFLPPPNNTMPLGEYLSLNFQLLFLHLRRKLHLVNAANYNFELKKYLQIIYANISNFLGN